ncbi:MAG: hypothetical protein VKJ02_02815 [Snowella sp.]|nr:hypothetical protein [Snowella sp.]
MNPPVNQPLETRSAIGQSPSSPTAATLETTESEVVMERQQPIPPPNHPRQYRAIGLVHGQYQPTEGHLTQGTLTTDTGKEIEAVLLGRMMSLIKNHIDLTQSHLWVVYPRTRQEDDHIHLQIVGIWEPETLKINENPALAPLPDDQQNGYFSIRGEVVFAATDQESIVVKIRQSPKAEGERPKFFKIKLKGVLPEKPVTHFWDLQAQLVGNDLVLQSATDLGLAQSKKPIKRNKKSRPLRKGSGRPRLGEHRPQSPDSRAGSPRPKPLPKPTKGDRS